MYQSPARAAPGAHYRSVDVSSKVEGASPHRLIAILYEELLTALATAKMAIRRGAPAQLNEASARATAIVHGLQSGLDYDKGGDVARALSSVYGEVVRLVTTGARTRDIAPIDQGQKMIGDLAEAWNKIGA